MITTLHPVLQHTSTSTIAATCAIFIDADNQPARHAAHLFLLIERMLGYQCAEAIIAGTQPTAINQWRTALQHDHAALVPKYFTVTPGKDAADVALILDLGANVARYAQQQRLIIILSADELFITVALRMQTLGIKVLLTHGSSGTLKRHAELPIVLLPDMTTTPPAIPANPLVSASSVTPVASAVLTTPAPVVTTQKLKEIMQHLKQTCPRNSHGGYPANHIGQALSQLGYDQAARKRIIEIMPGLTAHGTGSDKYFQF